MKDTNLNIYLSDIRSMISGYAEEILTKAALEDNVISIEDAIDCYTQKDIEHWLELNADYYGYTKVEE